MDSIKKVNNLCKNVLKLTDEDFAAVEKMIDEQMGYSHPLKHAKQNRLHAASNHNQNVLNSLKALKETILSENNKINNGQ